MSRENFILEVLSAAVQIQKAHGLPAAAITAQACLETGYGASVCKDKYSGQYSFNLFNIKGQGPAGGVLVTTWEVYSGVKKTITAKFRAYHNYQESFEDYVKLITGAKRYAPAVTARGEPGEYARQLQACGYATDPKYAAKIISIMDKLHLRELANQLLKKEGVMVPELSQAQIDKIMDDGKAAGVISENHRGQDPCPKWFAVAVGINVLRQVEILNAAVAKVGK